MAALVIVKLFALALASQFTSHALHCYEMEAPSVIATTDHNYYGVLFQKHEEEGWIQRIRNQKTWFIVPMSASQVGGHQIAEKITHQMRHQFRSAGFSESVHRLNKQGPTGIAEAGEFWAYQKDKRLYLVFDTSAVSPRIAGITTHFAAKSAHLLGAEMLLIYEDNTLPWRRTQFSSPVRRTQIYQLPEIFTAPPRLNPEPEDGDFQNPGVVNQPGLVEFYSIMGRFSTVVALTPRMNFASTGPRSLRSFMSAFEIQGALHRSMLAVLNDVRKTGTHDYANVAKLKREFQLQLRYHIFSKIRAVLGPHANRKAHELMDLSDSILQADAEVDKALAEKLHHQGPIAERQRKLAEAHALLTATLENKHQAEELATARKHVLEHTGIENFDLEVRLLESTFDLTVERTMGFQRMRIGTASPDSSLGNRDLETWVRDIFARTGLDSGH